jgi:PIN domain nuclease of toxin-antitoxin system
MNFLLDTQTFVWFVMGNARLPKKWRALIEHPLSVSYLSIASLWELAIKEGTGKLHLDVTFPELIEWHVLGSGFTILPVSINHLLELRKLPLHHRDPFDRIIIAQAIVENLTVVTTDPQFAKYPVRLIR